MQAMVVLIFQVYYHIVFNKTKTIRYKMIELLLLKGIKIGFALQNTKCR